MTIPLFRPLLLLAIRAYQRYISPYKGFSCAYRVHTGCASCSAFGYRAIRRYGSVDGLTVLRRRLKLCGETYRHHHPSQPINYQRGDCDPGCDLSCDHGAACDTAGNCLDCADCLDLFDRKRKDEQDAPH